ncbi:hypothetical protein APT_01669 [Acetobacter pasteurianus NBRC 101655]|nr:hypothetical protein APT_01669 [Acetobacter pasteurianus NBRC 101655]
MNNIQSYFGPHLQQVDRSSRIISLLDKVCMKIEPSQNQYDLAEERYLAVGKWIAGAADDLLQNSSICVQGSFATSTAIRPPEQSEYDVDLLCYVPNYDLSLQPISLKKALGDRLQQHATYGKMLEEKARCWRLNYANEFHMDITPAIPNQACKNGGCLVPDKELRRWKESNPRGYSKLFKARAALEPRFEKYESFSVEAAYDSVEPFPKRKEMQGFLRRIVQLSKFSRDFYFSKKSLALWPISIIITTLTSRSYEFCVGKYVFQDELDLLCKVVEHMPDTIICKDGISWQILNETTTGENFAEKWNTDPNRAKAFFAWHQKFLEDLRKLRVSVGLDVIRKDLSDSFGVEAVTEVFDDITTEVSSARQKQKLAVSAELGLTTDSACRAIIPKNTFYGFVQER